MMPWMVAGVVLAVVLALVLLVAALRFRSGPGDAVVLEFARRDFHRRREWLEARFLTLAAASGKPRGLAWTDCEFEDDVAYARDRQTGHLRALVGVAISFEAVEGGGMEDNPNVGNIRAATALFRFDGSRWDTDGRALFNLNPAEAIAHFRDELEVVDSK